jgi:hypothetical protein
MFRWKRQHDTSLLQSLVPLRYQATKVPVHAALQLTTVFNVLIPSKLCPKQEDLYPAIVDAK